MRGYQILRTQNRLYLLRDIKYDLTNTPLSEFQSASLITYAGKNKHDNPENVLRQFLLTQCAGLYFNKAVLFSISTGNPLKYPIPKEWRLVLEKHGIKANTFHNRIYWNIYIGIFLVYGIFCSVKYLLFGIGQITSKRNNKFLSGSVYFHALDRINLPNTQITGISYDIISWYHNWLGSKSSTQAYTHTVSDSTPHNIQQIPIVCVKSGVPIPDSISKITIYIYWLVKQTIVASSNWLRGKYVDALFYREIALAFCVRLHKKEELPVKFFFHLSSWIYRPLWTYEAERKGREIIFYFYATNIEGFKRKEGYLPPINSWQAISWTRFLVWDVYQRDFLLRCISYKADINIVGPIWFGSDSSKPLPELPALCISVFDVQPRRDSNYQELTLDQEYYVPDVINQFLTDIYVVATEFGMSIAMKQKRNIGSLVNKQYQVLVDKLSLNENFISIDPDIPAQKLIDKTSISISIPFTSTALIAEEANKPSYFYDPTGIVYKDDRAAHGIEIISGIQELRAVLRNHIITSKLYVK